MGWRAQPRYDKSRGNWFCRYRNKKHYLGVDHAEAHRRFAQIVGADGAPPLVVAEAIEQWLAQYGGREATRYGLMRWHRFAWTKTLSELPSDLSRGPGDRRASVSPPEAGFGVKDLGDRDRGAR